MNPKELEESYQNKKDIFHEYINKIKKNMRVDIYSIINTTLISNPYTSQFPKLFFSEKLNINKLLLLFIKSSFKFYIKQLYSFLSYLISFILYKVYYKKRININNMLINITLLTDDVISKKQYNENYFKSLYPILTKHDIKYTFVPRLYNIQKNPFKLIKLFKLINDDKRNFLLEYEFLTIADFLKLFIMILKYPFKTLRLIQKEHNITDEIFNQCLILDIANINFDSFSKYLFGQNISNINNIEKIYSWSEFQVTERSFNYGIRTNNTNIKIIACQFFLNYETYFNTYVEDIDYDQKTSPHTVLVNGKYYILDRKKVFYKEGVSLRYNDIFLFDKEINYKNIILLGSYIVKDTQNMLNNISSFKNILFKNHPAVNINRFGELNNNITIVQDNIYELFENASIVIGTASGTCVEAVACGISVIVIASQDNLTANPLVDYGKGEIWDIAFSKDDVQRLYNELIEYRLNNYIKIKQIASWYKNNFFTEPTDKNIIDLFELNLKRD